MSPPRPTKYPLGPGEAPPPKRRRIGVWLAVAAAMLGILGGGAWQYLRSPPRTGARPLGDPSPPGRGTMIYTPPARGAPTPWAVLLDAPADADPLAMNPAHRPLDREPADLPPPSEAAAHQSRYRLADGPMLDEVSFWRLPADDDTAAVRARYDAAARAAGFTPITADRPRPDSDRRRGQTMTFIRTAQADRARAGGDGAGAAGVLTIRFKPRAGGGHHVTVWLRKMR